MTIQIEELEIKFNYEGHEYAIYPTLIVLEEALTLVDTGYPGFLPKIEEAVQNLGYDMNNL